MRLSIDLPERLSVTDAARLARAVAVAVEETCGFIVEPQIENCEDPRP